MESNENSEEAALTALYERIEAAVAEEKNEAVARLIEATHATHEWAANLHDYGLSEAQRIAGILPDSASVILVYGPSTAGKSFLALDLAVRTTSHEPFAGKPMVMLRSAGEFVVYLAAEDHNGTTERGALWALAQKGGKSGRVLTMNFEGKSLARDLDAIEKTIDKLCFLVRPKGWSPCRLVVVDHLTAVAAGETMDADSTAETLMRSLHDLARSASAPVIAIHHTGRDGVRFRGSQVLFDRADAVWSVQPGKGDERTVRIEKMRNGPKSPGFRFRLVTGEVTATGEDGDVKTFNAAFVEHLGEITDDGDAVDVKNLSRRCQQALACLPPDAVTEAAARKLFEDANVISGNLDARRIAFRRILADLTKAGVITRADGLVHAIGGSAAARLA